MVYLLKQKENAMTFAQELVKHYTGLSDLEKINKVIDFMPSDFYWSSASTKQIRTTLQAVYKGMLKAKML
jgi:hypothetical protein